MHYSCQSDVVQQSVITSLVRKCSNVLGKLFESVIYNLPVTSHWKTYSKASLKKKTGVYWTSLFFSLEFEWSFSQDLSAILVKQEEPDVVQRLDPQPMEGPPLILSPAPPHRGSAWKHTVSTLPAVMKHCVLCCWFFPGEFRSDRNERVCLLCQQECSQDDVKPVAIKDEPREIGQYLSLPSGTCSAHTHTHLCKTDHYRKEDECF